MNDNNKPKIRISKETIQNNFEQVVSLNPTLNRDAKKRLFSRRERALNIDKISKAITHFSFRNGPVESMHANRQLSQEDMKTLNKHMVNALAYVFWLILSDRWTEFEMMINVYRLSGTNWDPAEIDDGGMRDLFAHQIHAMSQGKKPFLF